MTPDWSIVEAVPPLMPYVLLPACLVMILRGLTATIRQEPGLGQALLGVLAIGVIALVVPSLAALLTVPPDAEREDGPDSPVPTDEQTRAPADPPAADTSWSTSATTVLAFVVLACLTVLMLRLALHRGRATRARRREVQARWQRIVDQHEGLLRRYLAYETDWNLMFTYPKMIDPSVPSTKSMLRALQRAEHARTGIVPSDVDLEDLDSYPYPQAVQNFQVALEAAERHARRYPHDSLPAPEGHKPPLRLASQISRLAGERWRLLGAGPTRRPRS